MKEITNNLEDNWYKSVLLYCPKTKEFWVGKLRSYGAYTDNKDIEHSIKGLRVFELPVL